MLTIKLTYTIAVSKYSMQMIVGFPFILEPIDHS